MVGRADDENIRMQSTWTSEGKEHFRLDVYRLTHNQEYVFKFYSFKNQNVKEGRFLIIILKVLKSKL